MVMPVADLRHALQEIVLTVGRVSVVMLDIDAVLLKVIALQAMVVLVLIVIKNRHSHQ